MQERAITEPKFPTAEKEGVGLRDDLEKTVIELYPGGELRRTSLREHLTEHWATTRTKVPLKKIEERTLSPTELFDILKRRREQMDKGLRHAAPLIFSSEKRAKEYAKRLGRGVLPTRVRLCKYSPSDTGGVTLSQVEPPLDEMMPL